MNPDTLEAVERLAADGVIPAADAPRLSRIARGDLVSVRLEIRALLYAGVTLAVAGAGLFVKEHYREIGPAAITLALTIGAAGCLFHVARESSPFTWGRAPAATLVSQYVLLLGVLLLGADLAYLESQFRLLGPEWPYHLLLYSILAILAAYRFDSAAVLSLALSAFAAWRGVEVKNALGFLFRDGGSRARLNAIACGLLFLAGAAASARGRRKAHFEPVWGNLGCLLLFGGLLSGALASPAWTLWGAALLVACAAVLLFAVNAGREAYSAQAIIAGYLGAMRFLLHPIRDDKLLFLLVAASASATLWVLVRLHRRMQGRRAA